MYVCMCMCKTKKICKYCLSCNCVTSLLAHCRGQLKAKEVHTKRSYVESKKIILLK